MNDLARARSIERARARSNSREREGSEGERESKKMVDLIRGRGRTINYSGLREIPVRVDGFGTRASRTPVLPRARAKGEGGKGDRIRITNDAVADKKGAVEARPLFSCLTDPYRYYYPAYRERRTTFIKPACAESPRIQSANA